MLKNEKIAKKEKQIQKLNEQQVVKQEDKG